MSIRAEMSELRDQMAEMQKIMLMQLSTNASSTAAGDKAGADSRPETALQNTTSSANSKGKSGKRPACALEDDSDIEIIDVVDISNCKSTKKRNTAPATEQQTLPGEAPSDLYMLSPQPRKNNPDKQSRHDGHDGDDEISIDGDEEEYKPVETQGKGTKRTPLIAKQKPALYQAKITSLASSVRVGITDIDEGLMARAKKCLDRANHPSASEAEAKAALSLVRKMMKQNNISMSQIIEHIPPEAREKYGGQSVVSLTRTDGNLAKGVRFQGFLWSLIDALRAFFSCKAYTSNEKTNEVVVSLDITFYGIAGSTDAAARGFEMVYNLAVQWARKCKGPTAQSSYCEGIAVQLNEMARVERETEEKKAQEAEDAALAARIAREEEERQAQLDRLAGPQQNAKKVPKPGLQATVQDDDDSDEWTDCSESDALLNEIDSELADGTPWNNHGGMTEMNHSERRDVDDDTDDGTYMYDGTESDTESEGSNQVDFEDDEDDQRDNEEGGQERGSPQVKLEDVDSLIDNLVAAMPSVASTPICSYGACRKAYKAAPADYPDPQWPSRAALTLWRESEMQIADDYLKSQNVELIKGRTRATGKFDREAYILGREDGKKINPKIQSIDNQPAQERNRSASDWTVRVPGGVM